MGEPERRVRESDLGLYQQSFKDWKGRFYMITSNEHSPTLLEGFPLYWVPKVEFKKPRGLEAMAPYEHEPAYSRAWVLSSAPPPSSSTNLTRRRLRNILVCILFFPSTCYFSEYDSVLALNCNCLCCFHSQLVCHTCTLAHVNHFSAC